MIRIRAVHSHALPLARDCIAQVQEIFRQNFPELADYADKIPDLLADPTRRGYRAVVMTLETGPAHVNAFSLLLHFPRINSSFLDFIAVRRGVRGGGFGSALYEATREYGRRVGSRGLYMEVEPDDPAMTTDPEQLRESRQRLRFYERHGATPIIHTAYDEPIGDPPTRAFLLFDGLGRTEPLGRDEAREAVRLILTKRFGHVASPRYVRRVVESIQDDPVQLRPFRYVRKATLSVPEVSHRLDLPFALTSSPTHNLHHVAERGYFERPVRVSVLEEAVGQLGLFSVVPPRAFGEQPILAVHDRAFVGFLRNVSAKVPAGRAAYPDTFPIRRTDRRPKELAVQAGYYCIDSCTPLNRNAYRAARSAVDVALTGAEEILWGRRVAYALCRPPGHHAERRVYGGFCYFNNAAIAAQYLSRHGKAAILDIDYHHGNGTQDIFYDRSDVLTVSIHGHPDHAFPYFSGFADETGTGPGAGFNRNFPLPPATGGAAYLNALDRAARCVTRFRPDVLVVSLGFDTLRGDPTGLFTLTAAALRSTGRRLAALGLPMLVVQEGGYSLRNMRSGAKAFFTGVAAGLPEEKP